MMRQRNVEREQDRSLALCGTFSSTGMAMLPEQRRIYRHLSREIAGKTVLEAGCGNGIGTAMLERNAATIKATDKLPRNISLARELYPWIEFGIWDFTQPTLDRAQAVVCIEAIEHVADYTGAIRNLIAAARETVWISTPNGLITRKEFNPYHVTEFAPREMLELIGTYRVLMLSADWVEVDVDSRADPVVYRIDIRG